MTEQDWVAQAGAVDYRTKLFIGGEWVEAASGATFATINPFDGREIAQVARAGPAEVDAAVRAARTSFSDRRWSGMKTSGRMDVLSRLADLLDEHADELAVTDAIDGGKPISVMSMIEVPASAKILRWYAQAIDKVYGEVAPTTSALATIVRRPLGVIGAVIPWNYPLELAIWKIAPALATGNSVVLKPSEWSPLSALRLAELATEAGLPDGVLNVVPGLGGEAGEALGRHHDVDAIAFTGSTAVGKHFLRYSSESNMKQVWPECGGKGVNIVFADTEDLDAAVDRAVYGFLACSGQVCSANSRLLVESSIHDEFIARLIARAQTAVLGNPLLPTTTMGPLINSGNFARVERAVGQGLREAELVMGGRRSDASPTGFFFEPTVFINAPKESSLWRDEIPGPVLAVRSFDTEAEAVTLANDSVFGLSASVWTDDFRRAHRVAGQLDVGTVSVNSVDALDVTVPFGGLKQSGFGRDLSLHAFDAYTALKSTFFSF